MFTRTLTCSQNIYVNISDMDMIIGNGDLIEHTNIKSNFKFKLQPRAKQ